MSCQNTLQSISVHADILKMEQEQTDGPLSPKELLVNDIEQQEDKIGYLKKKLTLLVWTLRIINLSGWITQGITGF